MALTYMEELKRKQQGQTAQPDGLSGVSANTREQLKTYQNGYRPTQQANDARQNLQTVQQQKPQTYNSKYGAALDSILQEIQNPGSFKYDLNNDTLFQSYKDVMTEQARQGALNAQGAAAALTGGYGNSYGLSAGAQAYQQALLPLYERIPEFASLARQNYDADQDAKYRALGALQDADNTGYNRYRDTVADYNADLDRAREDARYEDETGYNRYMDALSYWQNQAAAENADYRTGQEQDRLDTQLAWNMDTDQRDYEESVRRADEDNDYRNRQLAEQIRGTDLDEKYRRDTLAESIRQNDADNDYRNRTFDETVRQNDLDNDYRNRTLDWNMATDARDFEAQQYWNNEENRLNWANLEEKQRQFDADLTEEQRQYNQKVAMSYASQILANGQMPSMELLIAAGLSYEDAQMLMAQISTGGLGTTKTTPTLKGSAADIAKDTGNTVKDIAKDMIYAGGNGVAGALSNFNGAGDLANYYTDMAFTGIDADGKPLTAEDRQLAANIATEAYNMSQLGKQNEANVDAYVRKMISTGQLGTNEEAMKELEEKQKRLRGI